MHLLGHHGGRNRGSTHLEQGLREQPKESLSFEFGFDRRHLWQDDIGAWRRAECTCSDHVDRCRLALVVVVDVIIIKLAVEASCRT